MGRGVRAEEDVTVRRSPGSNDVRVFGLLPPGGEWEGEVAVEDPALFATAVFERTLAARGIATLDGIATSSEALPHHSRVLAAHDGAPMARLIAEVNKESQNLHAELLLRSISPSPS